MYTGALDAAWWAALGAATRWGPNYTGIGHSETYTPAVSLPAADWLMIGISLGNDSVFYQAPFLTSTSDGGEQMSENNYDTGFFYVTDNLGPKRYPYQCAIPGIPNQRGIDSGQMSQCQMMRPYLNNGDVRPLSTDYPLFSAYYKTGFLYRTGNSGSLPYSHTLTFVKCPARGSTAYVHHYAPYAWAGTPPAAIAAIMLQMGQAAAYIDTAAFATAHDALRDDTFGDIPIDGPAAALGVSWTPVVYCARKVGQRVIDLMLEIISHTRDFYYAKENGVLSVSKFTASATVTSLGLSDGVLDVEWSLNTDLIFNSVSATWGGGYRQWGGPADVPSATGFACQQENELDSYQETKYVHAKTNAASIAKYGAIWLKGRERSTAVSAGRKIETAHYPLFLDPGVANTYMDYWETNKFGGMMHVTNWLASDSKERRMVTVRQDFRALDWGIGAKVTNVSVTDDAATIADTRCIERTYDFDRLTVESVLMEVPANT